MKKITVIGTGYVGLVSGSGLADFGNKVNCVDVNKKRIKDLSNGKIPFFEPGLKEIVERNKLSGRLEFNTNIAESISDSDVIFIAVWTPMANDGSADLTAVLDVAKTIGANISSYTVIATKSTVPIGTSKMINEVISNNIRGNTSYDLVSNPEFLREGAAVRDFLMPDRVVIGTSSQQAIEMMQEIYRPLYVNETPFVITDIPTAETIKYASNSFLAVKISYINELANLCDSTGADIHVVARAMGLDGRISPKFLHPGPGFGGSCFPKDTRALVKTAELNGLKLKVLAAAINANETQIEVIFKKLTKLLENNLSGKRIAILGLAFKANTDDIRESRALILIDQLLSYEVEVVVYDPAAMKNMKKDYPNLSYAESVDDAAKGSNAIVIMTDWNEFRSLDLSGIGDLMIDKIILDAKNLLSHEELIANGFIFEGVGRPYEY
ncbi:MAG: UDP-glucose 6-dehydrogenase [Candidatus Marinimicrobia bacterium]|nr:UDP-glucose 6-dehydrogenase [Candidatus Neomarinimicrobiota bacterium]MBF89399.1 UDP-glucose 6-dehydrogenase [Candidatus Neomarinimicrobiota bacterium]|tara:strand:+ start:19609 stop:20925 length:1317 start_codon:yes stop_codon:yes gene_type:complete